MFERKKRTGVMLCYPFEEKRLTKWNYPVIVQPKLDGVRCRAVWNGHSFVLVSSTEEILTSVPHVNRALASFLVDAQTGQPMRTEWDGELYRHGDTFEEIYSITARTANLHPSHENVEFHIFDYPETPDVQWERSVVLNELKTALDRTPCLRIVPSYVANSFDELMGHYDTILAQHYEGIIVRNWHNVYERKRSTMMMKFKPRKSDLYRIVDSVEELDKNGHPKNSLGALVCESDGERFNVGSGFTARHRQLLWEARAALPGMFVLVNYQHITPGRGVPRFPIFARLVDRLEDADA